MWRVRTPSGARAFLKRYGPDFSYTFLREVALLSGPRSVAGVVDADGFSRDETTGDFFLQARGVAEVGRRKETAQGLPLLPRWCSTLSETWGRQ